jgi:hypothetical protein
MPDIDLEDDSDSDQQERWGYVSWNPQARSRLLLQQVNEILDLYKPQRPLTLRQIYYRLVAQYHYPHNNAWYGNTLSRTLTLARRAEFTTNDGVLLFDVIRDDEFIQRDTFYYHGQSDFWNQTRTNANLYTLDRQDGQEQRLIIWCEGAGMVPQLERIADPLGIPVYSSGKFDGITCKRNLGIEWAEESSEHPIRVLHLGDHNPSGIHIFEALARDVIRFAEQTAEREGWQDPDIEFVRIALLPGQVIDIPPDVRNAKDNRRFDWMATHIGTGNYEHRVDINPAQAWELEALAPDQIAAIVRAAIAEEWDDEAYQDVLDEEKQARHILAQRLHRVEQIMVRRD